MRLPFHSFNDFAARKILIRSCKTNVYKFGGLGIYLGLFFLDFKTLAATGSTSLIGWKEQVHNFGSATTNWLRFK